MCWSFVKVQKGSPKTQLYTSSGNHEYPQHNITSTSLVAKIFKSAPDWYPDLQTDELTGKKHTRITQTIQELTFIVMFCCLYCSDREEDPHHTHTHTHDIPLFVVFDIVAHSTLSFWTQTYLPNSTQWKLIGVFICSSEADFTTSFQGIFKLCLCYHGFHVSEDVFSSFFLRINSFLGSRAVSDSARALWSQLPWPCPHLRQQKSCC